MKRYAWDQGWPLPIRTFLPPRIGARRPGLPFAGLLSPVLGKGIGASECCSGPQSVSPLSCGDPFDFSQDGLVSREPDLSPSLPG
jgi:hypothetical protein